MKLPESSSSEKNQSAINAQNEIDNRTLNECSKWNDKDWENAHNKLGNLPYLAADHKLYYKIDNAFYNVSEVRGLSVMSEYDSNASVEMIDPRLVVRAPSFQNWSTSYHPCRTKESTEKNEPSVIEIGRKITKRITSLPEDDISDDQTQKSLDDIYQNDSRGVKLERLHGPRGPIYITSDGSHRVAAAKLVGLKKIWAWIGETKAENRINLWFEALREMPEDAREELMRVYDLVYPPTKEDLTNEKKLTAKAEEQEQEYLKVKQRHDIERERELLARALKNANREKTFVRAKKIYKKLKGDPVFEQIRREEALEHIREYFQDKKDEAIYFDEEYRYEMTPDGYLLKKDGSESNVHVTGYDIGPNSYSTVLARAVQAYEHRHPDKIAKIETNI